MCTQSFPKRWIRAFLLPAFNERFSIWPLAFLRGIAAFITFIVIVVDAGIYDTNFNIKTPKSGDGDKSPWIVYGTNIAMVLCFLYFLTSVFLVAAPTSRYEMNSTPITPNAPKLAYVVWVLHTLAMPAVFSSLIVYTALLRDNTTYRQSQEAGYIIVFVLMLGNFLLSSISLRYEHCLWTGTAVGVYLILLSIYDAVFNTRVYPSLTTFDGYFLIILLCVGVHLFLSFVELLRTSLLTYCNCYLPLDEVAVHSAITTDV